MTALDDVLWIGGAQWAGKTTVTTLLAARYPVVTYRYDYHDARSHAQRAADEPLRFPVRARSLRDAATNPDLVWVLPTPEQMAETTLLSFVERFELVREDLALMPAGTTVVAEGWGLRPSLVEPLLRSPQQAVFLVPSDEFRERQVRELGRAGSLSATRLSDPARAQRNRVERDAILGRDVVSEAARLGLRVIEVDGSLDEVGVTALVEEQFRPFLPEWIY